MIVRVVGNKVIEIIPSEARPLNLYYPDWFIDQCYEAPDEVMPNWIYDPDTGVFSKPPEPDEPEPMPETMYTEQERVEWLEGFMEGSGYVPESEAEE